MTDERIDSGRPFDWGRTSEDYAKYRDIYPELFYQKIVDRGLCVKGQRVLDLGTGTGVLPRNLYRYGANWVGIDSAPEQIEQAKRLAAEAGMEIDFRTIAAERLEVPAASFDVVTACQCFWYFDPAVVLPKLHALLKPGGKLVLLYMAWLPQEDPIAGASEALALRYNPAWSGAGEVRRPIGIPDLALQYFERIDREEYDLRVPFTRERWHGRMKTCRGIGASLSEKELASWETDHRNLLERIAPPEFEVLHYAALAVLQRLSRA